MALSVRLLTLGVNGIDSRCKPSDQRDIIISMKTPPTLNPMVFVKDENSSEFRAHILRRSKEAADPKNRLPLSELKKRLAKHGGNSLDG